MGVLDTYRPGDRPLGQMAARSTLIRTLELIGKYAGPEVVRETVQGILDLREGAQSVVVDGLRYLVAES